MADDRDDSQRTEEPTQRRLDDAREHGDLVKSAEISTLVVLAGGAISIAMFGHATAEGFARAFRVFLEQPDQMPLDGGGVLAIFRGVLWHLLMLLVAPLALIAGMSLAGHLMQNRPAFAIDRLKPDFAKLSLISGFKRMFGFEGLMNMAKGLLKIAIVGAVVWMTVWPERGRMESTLGETPGEIAGDMVHLLLRILVAALATLAAIAAGDYLLQRFQFLKRNRMSRQEIKDEFKRTEGDPTIKARLRQMRIERAKKRMMAEVPKATVVIANPTHFAVALRYEQGKTPAPICVAKGMDSLALRIREVAEEHKVPVVENPPLARTLFAAVEIDQAIPAEHYKAVAQIIGYVLRITRKNRR
jgi:flagellar biosynthetic protein FlhB